LHATRYPLITYWFLSYSLQIQIIQREKKTLKSIQIFPPVQYALWVGLSSSSGEHEKPIYYSCHCSCPVMIQSYLERATWFAQRVRQSSAWPCVDWLCALIGRAEKNPRGSSHSARLRDCASQGGGEVQLQKKKKKEEEEKKRRKKIRRDNGNIKHLVKGR